MATAPAYNCLICGQNYADVNSYYAPAFSALPGTNGAQYSPLAPLVNIQNPILAFKARTVNCVPADNSFVIDLKTPRSIAAIVIPRHNLDQNGTFTFSVYTDAALNQLVGTYTGNVSPIAFPFGTVSFPDPHFWYGNYTAEEFSSHVVPMLAVFNPSVVGRYVVVQPNNPTNAAGYLELSRLVISPGFQPSSNFSYGATLTPVDPSIITTTLGGFRAADLRPKYREIHVTFQTIDNQTALTQFFDTQFGLGRTGQLFFAMNPTDSLNLFRTSFLANLKQLDPLTTAYFGYSGVAYSLIEVIA